MTKKQLNILPLLLAVLLLVSGCSKETEPGTTQSTGLLPTAIAAETPDPNKKTTGIGFYFDTVVSLSLWGAPEGLMDEIWAACARYEQLLSKTIDASDVSRINNAMGQTVTVDPETWEILRRAKEISAQTGGAFSITIAPVTALWSFTDTVTNMVPTDEARLKMLPLVDDQQIALGENNTVTLPAGMEIDLGGIAKGYIADRVTEFLSERGVVSAVVDLGGNIVTIGHKTTELLPGLDTDTVTTHPFNIGIKDPQSETGTLLAVFPAADKTVVTSGTYERFLIEDGVKYHHILDPKTGWPIDNDVLSVTIIAPKGCAVDADGLSTTCLALGVEKGMELIESLNHMGVEAVFVDADGEIHQTEGAPELTTN